MESIRRTCFGLEDGMAAAGLVRRVYFGLLDGIAAAGLVRRVCFGLEDGIAAAGLVRTAWNVLKRAGMYEQDGTDVRVLDPSSTT